MDPGGRAGAVSSLSRMRSTAGIALALAVSLNGCMSIIVGTSPQAVSIATDPPGALATASGQTCRTPGALSLERDRDHVVQCSHEGCASGSGVVESHHRPLKWIAAIVLNGAHGIFTLGISFAIGMAIDISTGSLQDLEPRTVFVPLQRWEDLPPIPLPRRLAPPPPPSPPPSAQGS